MTDYQIHRPTFVGTTKNDWEFPTEQQFDTDDLASAASHFLLSASGFEDPERYDDLALPVVNSRGLLSLNALWAARRGPYSVERVAGVDEETAAETIRLIDDLGADHFAEFQDVTVTASEWAAVAGGEPANPLGGAVGDTIGASTSSYAPSSAAVGLAFLAGSALALEWYRNRD